VFCSGVEGRPGDERIDALVRCLDDRGDSSRRIPGFPDAAAIEEADLLVLRSLPATDRLLTAIAHRRARRRPTVVDLAVDDLDDAADQAPLGLVGDTRRLVEACGLVTSASAAWCAELRRAGIVAHRLPTPHRPTQQRPTQQRLDPEAPAPTEIAPTTLVWMLDPAPAPDTTAAAVTSAVASAMVTCLLTHPGLTLQVHGDPRRWPSIPTIAGQIEMHAHDPEPWELARAALLVWAPEPRIAAASGDPSWLVRAGLSGVPTLLAATTDLGGTELLPPALAVVGPDRASAWEAAVTWLLADPTDRHLLGTEVRLRAEAACSNAVADRSVQELLTWAFANADAPADRPVVTEEVG
jgi:hypothetical protein